MFQRSEFLENSVTYMTNQAFYLSPSIFKAKRKPFVFLLQMLSSSKLELSIKWPLIELNSTLLKTKILIKISFLITGPKSNCKTSGKHPTPTHFQLKKYLSLCSPTKTLLPSRSQKNKVFFYALHFVQHTTIFHYYTINTPKLKFF